MRGRQESERLCAGFCGVFNNFFLFFQWERVFGVPFSEPIVTSMHLYSQSALLLSTESKTSTSFAVLQFTKTLSIRLSRPPALFWCFWRLSYISLSKYTSSQKSIYRTHAFSVNLQLSNLTVPAYKPHCSGHTIVQNQSPKR